MASSTRFWPVSCGISALARPKMFWPLAICVGDKIGLMSTMLLPKACGAAMSLSNQLVLIGLAEIQKLNALERSVPSVALWYKELLLPEYAWDIANMRCKCVSGVQLVWAVFA